MQKEEYCTECGKVVTELDVINGDTRLHLDQIFHKKCLQKLIKNEQKKLQSESRFTNLMHMPKFIVAWWTPYFWIILGLFNFITVLLAFDVINNKIVFNLETLQKMGSTEPPLLFLLITSLVVNALMIVYGVYLFQHAEEN